MIAAIAGGACEKPAAPAPAASWPAGTVLVMNGQPISAEEVDRIGADFAQVEPHDSLTQLRRLALTNVIFPRIAAATAYADRRAQMLSQAQSYREALAAGNLPSGPLAGPMEIEHKGGLLDIGMEIWHYALDAQIDRWSPVLETVGSFQIARVRKRWPGRTPALTQFVVGVFDFRYADTSHNRKAIEDAIDHSRLVIVDEAWREIVPTAWIYRMRGETP
jgi:hypothetical protein